MNYEFVTSARGLEQLCRNLADAPTIAFDTEFVSEHTYRPQLCLVQVAVADRLIAIDPFSTGDLRPFWELVTSGQHDIVVHAGREEIGFCLESVERQPTRLLDVQLAAGLIGMEYPAGYGGLVQRLVGQTTHKAETRTDWRRRPLSDRQIQYALDDVRYLIPLRDTIVQRLTQLQRMAWLAEETASWQQEIIDSMTRDRWRRVTGSAALSARSRAIVREIWQWREGEAQRRNVPARKVLRDDLIVELAKRRSADPQQIRAIRGFERRDFRQLVPDLAEAIARGLEVPETEVPALPRTDTSPQLTMLGQFLSSALSSICRAAEVAPSLVGTPNDVRELVAYRLNTHRRGNQPPPCLTQGWRAQVVGQLIDDLLTGQVSIRIADPASEQPLAFERRPAE